MLNQPNRFRYRISDKPRRLSKRVALGLGISAAAVIGLSAPVAGQLISVSGDAKLTASDGAELDRFGGAVDIDGNFAIVGAASDDEDVAGAAYVYERINGVWVEQANLSASDAQESDQFGSSVAIENGVAIVGARNADGNGNGRDSGAAYVFEQTNNGSWNETALLIASDGARDGQFGISASIDGGVVVIGANGDDGELDSEDAPGSAYVFEQANNGSWNESAILNADDAEAGDQFGVAVAIDGETVVVGARFGDDTDDNSGAAYVFEQRNNGNWAQEAKLVASDAAENDFFGQAVAVNGETAIVGAWSNDVNGRNSGSAYIFERGDGSWSQDAQIEPAAGNVDDFFGLAVAVDGDIAVVASRLDDDNGSDSGSATVFLRANDGSWGESAQLIAGDGGPGDLFGFSIALDGDTAIAGASNDNDFGANSGSAHVFDSIADDRIGCNGFEVTVNLNLGQVPTAGDDVILGTPSGDVIDGLGGNDLICGEDGNDEITGGPGNDHIFGGRGKDDITGGAGDDILVGENGADELNGGKGKDTLSGGNGADELNGDNGNDTINGGGGADTINGGGENDILSGGNGKDVIDGDTGDDQLAGGKRNDVLNGGAGADTLAGGRGADTLDGGADLDALNGGNGSDTCVVDPDQPDEVFGSCEQ